MNLALRRKLEDNRKERESLKQSQTAKAQDTSNPAAFKVTTGQVGNPKQKTSLCRKQLALLICLCSFCQKHVSQKSWEEMEKRLELYIERLEKRQLFNP